MKNMSVVGSNVTGNAAEHEGHHLRQCHAPQPLVWLLIPPIPHMSLGNDVQHNPSVDAALLRILLSSVLHLYGWSTRHKHYSLLVYTFNFTDGTLIQSTMKSKTSIL